MPSRIGRPFVVGPGAASSRAQPARFKTAGDSLKLDIKEPSDVVALPNGRFLVVGDRSDSVSIVDGSRQTKVKLEGLKDGKSGLEAAAFNPNRRQLFVASEEKGRILRYSFDAERGTAKLEKEIAVDLGGARNKGVEGLAWLPGDQSPTGRPQLIVAKEGDPKTLALLEEDGTGKPRVIALDAALDELAGDFSALAVDPRSGNLFVASDESALVAEVKLRSKGGRLTAELVQSLPLRDEHDEPLDRVEGIAFDARGNLHVLLENDRQLLKLERK